MDSFENQEEKPPGNVCLCNMQKLCIKLPESGKKVCFIFMKSASEGVIFSPVIKRQ